MSKENSHSTSSEKLKGPDGQDNPDARLPGWPGYRTRGGRSGLDPIDTRTEAAHTAGTLIQRLITGQIRNPVYLLLLGGLGVLLITPLLLAVSEMAAGRQLPWNAWLFILITGIAGLAILINFIRNLKRMLLRK